MFADNDPHLNTLAELNRQLDELVGIDNQRPLGQPRPLWLHEQLEDLTRRRNLIYQLTQTLPPS